MYLLKINKWRRIEKKYDNLYGHGGHGMGLCMALGVFLRKKYQYIIIIN